MNIANHLIRNYDSGLQGKIRNEQMKESDQTNAVRTPSGLANLKEGTVFKGEILDIAGDKVTISLEDQAKLQARLQDGVELGVGDQLLFSVKENNQSQVLIKPMFDSLYSAQTQMLEKVLQSAGLSPTEKNFAVSKELMDAGMPLDKGSIVKVLSQSMKFEGAGLSTLVALNKMNIPVTQENIAQYERYENYSHQLSNDIEQTAQSIADFTSMLPPDLTGEQLLDVTNQILNVFSKEQDANTTVQEESENDMPKEAVTTLPEQEENGTQSTIGLNSILEKTKTESFYGIKNEEVIKQESSLKEEKQIEQNPVGLQEENMVEEKEKPIQIASKEFAMKMDVEPELLKTIDVKMEQAGFTDIERQNLAKQSETPLDLMKNLTTALQEKGADTFFVNQILNADGFKAMLLKTVKDNWAMDPQNMKHPKEIDDLYEKIDKQSKEFEQAIQTKGGDTQSFQQNSQNMRQNMSFMEQLNQQMIYAQMPLKLSNQNANSELFVYADKRRLVEKKDGISVMLHLDMDHLGTTDVKVTLTGLNVHARFYFNEQESVDIVVENMEQLEESLKKRGFSLSNEVVKRQPKESINKVVDEIIDENAEKSVKRFTFDVKM